MKFFNSFLNEARKTQKLEYNRDFVDSYLFHSERDKFLKLFDNESVIFYHGTNRDFDKFDIKKSRDVRNVNYFGNGIFLTPLESIAKKYSKANANNYLDKEVLDNAKKVDKRLYQFMLDIYKLGNEGWSKWIENRSELNKLDKFLNDKFDTDMNQIATIVEYIDGANNVPDEDDMSLFGSSSGLPYYIVEEVLELGLGDYRNKVYEVEVNTNKNTSILVTKSRSKAKKSKDDIIIVFDDNDLVDGVPELIIRNDKLIKIKSKYHFDDDYDEYDISSWTD